MANKTLKIGSIVALALAVLLFFIAYTGVTRMIAESSIYSTWNLDNMILLMMVAFLIAVIVAVIGFLLK